MARLILSNLNKVYQTRRRDAVNAVNNLSLEVGEAELIVLTGPSGSGKTTTLRLIAGLEKPTSGTISMDGKVINDLAPKDRDVAMMFQSDALFPHLTAAENIGLGLRLRNVPKIEIARRVQEAAEMLEIAPCLNRFPGELSGGERRRVALGRAIVRQPKLFLLDEPLSNLDAPLRGRMRELIARVHTQLKATMIWVTHDEADASGQRVVRLTRQ